MDTRIDRRSALKAGAALAAACALPAAAQAKHIRFAAVFSDRDIRANMMQMFAKDIEADFKLEPFYNGTLFKQGTELVACSATTSKWATSRRRTSPSRSRPGRS